MMATSPLSSTGTIAFSDMPKKCARSVTASMKSRRAAGAYDLSFALFILTSIKILNAKTPRRKVARENQKLENILWVNPKVKSKNQ